MLISNWLEMQLIFHTTAHMQNFLVENINADIFKKTFKKKKK